MTPHVKHHSCRQLVFWSQKRLYLDKSVELGGIDLYPGLAMVVTCQSHNSNALKHTLLYRLFNTKWNPYLENEHLKTETNHRDHKLTR